MQTKKSIENREEFLHPNYERIPAEMQYDGLAKHVSEFLNARAYEGIFSLFRQYRDVISGVTLWGIADDMTWLDNYPVKNRKNWPLLFDTEHQPKKVFFKVVDF